MRLFAQFVALGMAGLVAVAMLHAFVTFLGSHAP